MSCDEGEVTERLENEQSSVASPASQLILQPFRCFTYVTAHSPTLLSLLLRHSSFSNPSVVLPTLQLILQPFRCFTYATAHSTFPLLHLGHRNFTYVTWQAAHVILLHTISNDGFIERSERVSQHNTLWYRMRLISNVRKPE